MQLPNRSTISALALLICLAAPTAGTCGQPPFNDTCDLAFVNSVFLNPGLNAGLRNVAATVSGVTPSCIGTTPIQPPLPAEDVWYVYGATASCAITFTLNAPQFFLPIMAIYDGNAYAPGSCGTLPELACDATSTPVTLNVNAGDVLFIQIVSIIPGNTGAFEINVQASFGLNISAPGGAGSLQVDNSCGSPAANYLTVFTPIPGAFPNGWFFGVDITIPDIITQASLGAPFSGNLDANGNSSWSTPIGIPSGLSVFAVTVELSSMGVPVTASPPTLFMTL